MSELSGFDSEAIGFDCISSNDNPKISSSSQTSKYSQTGVPSQTVCSKEIGCMTSEVNSEDVLTEYPPPGLNEFLRKVVPAVMEQLEQNDRDFLNNSSESDEEDILSARLIQEITTKDRSGSGDHDSSVLGITWSSSGNSFAVSIGQMVHDTWCQNPGQIKVFTLKRNSDTFVSFFDMRENNCVTVLRYHPTIAALMAYGTTSGEVVVCNMVNGNMEDGVQLTSPSGCHGARRITCLHWADASLANMFLLMQIKNKKRRRGASDQVLISSGASGTINVFQVNANQGVFESIVVYKLNASRKFDAPDITCFDFIKTYPLRPSDEKSSDDIFVAGTKSGKLLLCKITDDEDPVYEELESHGTCVLDVAFNTQKPTFVSISIDSEIRVYDVNQRSPIKVICLDVPISSMSWLSPPCLAVGLAGGGELLRVYNVSSGRVVPLAGLSGDGDVTCVAVHQRGSRIAAGDKNGIIRLWHLPSQRMKNKDENWI